MQADLRVVSGHFVRPVADTKAETALPRSAKSRSRNRSSGDQSRHASINDLANEGLLGDLHPGPSAVEQLYADIAAASVAASLETEPLQAYQPSQASQPTPDVPEVPQAKVSADKDSTSSTDPKANPDVAEFAANLKTPRTGPLPNPVSFPSVFVDHRMYPRRDAVVDMFKKEAKQATDPPEDPIKDDVLASLPQYESGEAVTQEEIDLPVQPVQFAPSIEPLRPLKPDAPPQEIPWLRGNTLSRSESRKRQRAAAAALHASIDPSTVHKTDGPAWVPRDEAEMPTPAPFWNEFNEPKESPSPMPEPVAAAPGVVQGAKPDPTPAQEQPNPEAKPTPEEVQPTESATGRVYKPYSHQPVRYLGVNDSGEWKFTFRPSHPDDKPAPCVRPHFIVVCRRSHQ